MWRRLMRTWAHVMAYKQATGGYPASLGDVPGAAEAVDVYSEGSLVYRREGESFRLYSVGEDGVDDGGVHDRSMREGSDYVIWPVK